MIKSILIFCKYFNFAFEKPFLNNKTNLFFNLKYFLYDASVKEMKKRIYTYKVLNPNNPAYLMYNN